MNTTVINLFGAPGVGKSTIAAEIFAKLNVSGESCELVREFVKLWSWENKPVTPLDQIYLLGKQVRSEAMLYGKVRYIVTDSPILLVGAYQQLFFGGSYIQEAAMSIMEEARERYGITYKNYVLPKVVEYKTEGRYHSEEDAHRIGAFIPNYLTLSAESYKIVTTEANERSDYIIKDIYEH